MKIDKKIVLNKLYLILIVFFLSNAFISPSINPFIFSFCVALVFNDCCFYSTSIGLLLGLFCKMQNLASILISLNAIAVLLIIKTLINFKIFKNKSIFAYFCLIFAQVSFIYFNLYSKTAIISVIVSCLASLLFLFVYNVIIKSVKTKSYKNVYSLDEKICGGVTLVSITLGLSNIELCGFYFVYPICLFVIYFMCLTNSQNKTLLISTLFALGIALTNNSVLPFAIILIWSIVCLLLSSFNKYAMVIGLVITDILLGGVFNAYISYSYLNLISTLLPSIVVICIPNSKFRQISMFFAEKQRNIAKNYMINENYNQISKKLNSLSLLFSDLEQIYKSMLTYSLPEDKLGDFLASQIIAKQCNGCGYNCREKTNLIESLKEVVLIALSKGKISLVDWPNNFNLSCPFINQIISQINDGVGEYIKYKSKVEEQNSTLVALTESCQGVSKITKDISSNLNGLKINENINIDEIIGEFSVNNLQVKEVLVLKDDNNPISKIILILREENAGNLKFAEVLSKIFKMKLYATQINSTKISGWKAVTYELAPKYNVFHGYFQNSKHEKCGDNMLYTQIDLSRYVLALADGMGTGEKASVKSNLCLDLLLSYLKLGIDRELMLSSINNLMFKTDNSSFSTLDLVEFNCYSGRADFIKLASSASFIKRAETCVKIVPESLPLGIISEITPFVKTEYVSAGEFIILCSDGVVDAFGEDELEEFINSERTANAQLLAEAIVEEAGYRGANDDVTCCVLKINNY